MGQVDEKFALHTTARSKKSPIRYVCAKKQLQKYKVDFKQGNLSPEETISTVENMIKISQIIYAKTKYMENL